MSGRRAIAGLGLVLLCCAGCRGGGAGAGAARTRYNEALAKLEAKAWEEAQQGFLKARDEAGQDPELRFRAACDLGLAYARPAEEAAGAKPDQALELLRQSAAWLRDAVRLRPDDLEARQDLELVLRRTQLLADQLNKGQNSLAARLDRLIDDLRGLRDRVRALIGRLEEAGAKTEPTAFGRDFDELATAVRVLQSEAGVVVDLAGDELGLLERKAEGERTDEDRMRMVQLKRLDQHLGRGRSAIVDVRHDLRGLDADGAHRRAQAALDALKRAREQLEGPVAILGRLAGDEAMLATHAGALAAIRTGAAKAQGGPAAAPRWLSPADLGERQADVRERTGEIAELFAVAPTAAAARAQMDGGTAPTPEQQRMLAAATEALPHVREAEARMQAAGAALKADRAGAAADEAERAVQALARAIERFAGLREVIEVAHATQEELVALLAPPGAAASQPAARRPEPTPAERERRLQEGVAQNVERLTRLGPLLAEEGAKVAAKAPPAADGGVPGQDPQAAVKARFELAEKLRGQALAAERALAALLGRGAAAKPADARARAAEAQQHLAELRRLFFSIIEHLKELHRNQGETHDATAAAHGAEETSRAAKVGPLADFQERHARLGEALAQALAEQADQAGQAGGPGGPQGEAQMKALREAAPEVRSAATEMRTAAAGLAEARTKLQSASYDLEPTLKSQTKAMEHLENAIRLLEPPKQQQQQQQQQKQQKQQQQQGDDDEKKVSRRQAERRLQAIRDREAQRDRDRRERERLRPEPVEKDW